MEKRQDPYTLNWFTPEKTNQIFEDRKSQVAYNNQKAKKQREENAPFDGVLKKNKKILASILGDKKEVIKSRDFLLGAGFDFSIVNNGRAINNISYHGVYQFGFRKIENTNNYQLINFNYYE